MPFSRSWHPIVVLATVLPLCLIGIGLAQPPGMPRQPGGGGIAGGGISGGRGGIAGGPGIGGPSRPPNEPGFGGPNRPPSEPDTGGFGRFPSSKPGHWEFRCSNCNALLGTSYQATDEPTMGRCPNCGVALTGGFSNPALSRSSSRMSTILLILGGGLILLIVAGGIGALVWVLSRKPAVAARRRSSRPKQSRPRDDSV